MAAAVTRKRSAPDGDGPCSSGRDKKRPRLQFGTIDDYEKLEALGEGTYGVVVKARHRNSGDTVAVKWFRAAEGGLPDLRAVLREAGCMAACRGHPSVAAIRDVVADEATGDLFLVMDFVGPSLRRRLSSRRFSEDETRGVLRQLLLGLKKIHAAGMIHRDIKPDNVLVGPDGTLKICDFGMATTARSPYRGKVGSVWYNSPEQLMGSRCYGPAIDVWAVGCVMAELLTGRALFRHVKTEDDMMTEVFDLRDEIDAKGLQAFKGLPELSQEGGEVLLGLMCFDEDQRLTAADALRHRWFAREEEADSSCSVALVAQQESPEGFISGSSTTLSLQSKQQRRTPGFVPSFLANWCDHNHSL